MNNALSVPDKAHRALELASTPEETKVVEGYTAVGMAWTKEHKIYDQYVEYARLYVLARRKTAELIRPFIHVGRPRNGDEDVTILEDFGFTRKQWNRRCKELDLPIDQIEDYFSECFANGHWPSIAGLFRFQSAPPDVEPCLCPICGREHIKRK